jgi:two-component system cell cycle sensor histidine kinase PleC
VLASLRSTIVGHLAKVSAALVALRCEISASLKPQTPAQVHLVDQQLAIARQSSGATMYILPAAAAAIAYANRGGVPFSHLILWPLIVAVACIGSELYVQSAAKRFDKGSPRDVRERAQAFAGMTLATSTAWALMLVMLWAPDAPVNHMFLILIVASTISGWSSLGASHLASALASMPVYFAFMVTVPLVSNDPLDITLGVLSLGFWIIMTGLLYTNYKTRERMLKLEMERGPLIDDLRRAKAESDRARDRAETASRAKSAFLANMSHELRTPLNAILGFSEIIHTRALGAAAINQYAEYGGFIHDSGKHLLTLINDILDLAKIEAGRLALREEEVSLARLISDSVQMLTVRALAGKIRLRADMPPDLPNVFGDERALRQIILNLLSNALKFTPPNGEVTVFAGVDGDMKFGVADTGVGIELEDQAGVFESFGQGRHDAVIADQGTGLGLAIVKGLAESHGGAVALASTPGEGTRVTVTLPANRIRERRTSAAA